MPPSQLKRLKASLREQGITGQQKSRKQKKAGPKNGSERIQRSAALQQIRDSFNPFEFKAPNARPEKFATVSHKSANAMGSSGRYRGVLHRPGVAKSAGEDMRRATLLPEMRRRNKVGGLIDRRIGEGDVDMTPEEKAAQRFAREKEGKRKGAGLFDLEASDDEDTRGAISLTHGGRSLGDLQADDFGDEASTASEEEDDSELLMRKRRRSTDNDADDMVDGSLGDQQPERKRTKKEVMEEVIAKSKLHKYERQKAKDDDEDLREALDKGIGEMMTLLKGHKRPPQPLPQPSQPYTSADVPAMNPDRQRLLDGTDRSQVDREYDVRLKQLAQDTRAKPSERTKTAEEKAAAEVERLRLLEEKRVKRMQGDAVSDDELEEENDADVGGDEDVPDQAAEFGFASSAAMPKDQQLVLEDEDEFALDENLIASGSDAGLSDMESVEGDDSSDDELAEPGPPQDEEDEFIKDIVGTNMAAVATGSNAVVERPKIDASGLSYTYPCPRSHEEFLGIVEDLPTEQLPTVIQRIRALYHPSLSASNKEVMADFSCALVDHLAYMGNQKQSLVIVEQLMRHLHSLSRTYPTQIGEAFRKHLSDFNLRGQPTAGDFVILTAIGSIYPTSDHWHQVVTPAITTMARWLGLNAPMTGTRIETQASNTGALFVALCIKYQTLSQRYIPEALRFTLRVISCPSINPAAHVANLIDMANLWKSKSAFIEIFKPALQLSKSLSAKKEHQALRILLQQARLARRPLELHHHRPLAIRMSIPKFEENFNPDKHYDPDKERSDASKLQKEYKRERKGALRELRKDANFIAREQLREKRVRDEEYEKKYRRLVASVQAEEGREKREYEREKAGRKRKR